MIPQRSPLRWLTEAALYVRFYRDPIGTMVRLYQRSGPFVAVRPGGQPIVFGFGPRYNKIALEDPTTFHSKSILLPGPPGSAQRRLNAGLLTMNGEQHRRDRRIVSPPFARKALSQYHSPVVKILEDVLSKWRPGEVRDIVRDMTGLATRISSYSLFGVDDEDEANTVGTHLRHWLHQNFRLSVRMFRRDLPGSPFRKLLRMAEEAEQSVRAMIDRRPSSARDGNDVLSILIRAHDEDPSQMTEDQLIGHAAVLFGASHETTIAALSWSLLLLFQHPNVCHDLLDELDGCSRGGAPTLEQLEKMSLLDGVVKESLRLIPPVAFSSRRAVRVFEINSVEWPAGTTLVFSHYITHHMSELYSQPQQFIPTRWQSIRPSHYEYLPFSAGPRTCLGMDFSLMEQKLTLAMLFQRYRLTPLPHARIDRASKLVTMPHGLLMRVLRQDREFAATPLRGNVHEMVDFV